MRHVRYALGFRLPPENTEWVRHDLTDAGWRGRMMVRHLTVISPLSVMLGLIPAEWWIRVLVAVLALVTSSMAVLLNAGDLRDARLRRHGLPVPRDKRGGQ